MISRPLAQFLFDFRSKVEPTDEHSKGASVTSNEGMCVCVCVFLTSSLQDWYKSALNLEMLDTCAPRAFSIAFDIVKSNFMALWNF